MIEIENKPLKFKIQGIKTEQFAIFDEYYIAKESTALKTELQFKIDPNVMTIGVFIGVEFLHAQKVFLKIQVSCHFKVEDTSWQSFKKNVEKESVIPRSFLAHLAMITTGTTRGILFAKTESTVYSKYIIPTLNVDKMISDDITFQ